MSVSRSLRESLEDARTAKLQRQIRAIRARLDHWDKCKCAYHDRQFSKLWAKERRLLVEARQPMLIITG